MRPEVLLLTEEDLENAGRLEQACFSDPWSQKLIHETFEASQYTFLGVKSAEELIAYGIISVVFSDCDIENICVNPALRKQGIGEALLNAMILEGRQQGADRFHLEVRASNENAIYLYEKTGFQQIGMRKDYYRNPTENALIYILE